MDVLIVEDEIELAYLYAESLQTISPEVFAVMDEATALSAARQNLPKVVVSDLKLGKGSGLSLFENLKNTLDPCPAFILISGYTELDEQQALHLGMVACLQKPFPLNTFRTLIKNFLEDLGRAKRKFKRIPLHASGLIFRNEFEKAQIKMKDVSLRGVGLTSSQDLGLDVEIDFQIEIHQPDVKVLKGSGLIRWKKKLETQYLYGVEPDWSEDSLPTIQALIN